MACLVPGGLFERGEGEGRAGLLKSAVQRAQLKRLALRGLNATEAARVVGCSPYTARAVFRDPGFREGVLGGVDRAFQEVDVAWAAKRQSWAEKLEEAADKAFVKLVEVLDNPDSEKGLVVKVAQDFMNRHPESAAVNHSQVEHKFSAEELADAARTAQEMNLTNVIQIRTGV